MLKMDTAGAQRKESDVRGRSDTNIVNLKKQRTAYSGGGNTDI